MHALLKSQYGDIRCVFGMHCNKWMRFKGAPSFFLPLFLRTPQWSEVKTSHKGKASASMCKRMQHFQHILSTITWKWALLRIVKHGTLFVLRTLWLCALKYTNTTSTSPPSISPLIPSVNRPLVHLFPLCYLGDIPPPPPPTLSSAPSFLPSHPNILLFLYLSSFYQRWRLHRWPFITLINSSSWTAARCHSTSCFFFIFIFLNPRTHLHMRPVN